MTVNRISADVKLCKGEKIAQNYTKIKPIEGLRKRHSEWLNIKAGGTYNY
jgi:hypothetical protein